MPSRIVQKAYLEQEINWVSTPGAQKRNNIVPSWTSIQSDFIVHFTFSFKKMGNVFQVLLLKFKLWNQHHQPEELQIH